MRPGPAPWSAQGAETFSTLNFVDPEPSANAKRWDAAEAATAFNFNLAAMDASVRLVARIGPELVLEHNRRLINFLFDRLPETCVPASPLDAVKRGAFGCFTARNQGETAELYQRLRSSKIVVSMREGRIRVSPHLFNSELDIDRLIDAVTE
jgi:selenocysteine lyase/cysteine desulfurase